MGFSIENEPYLKDVLSNISNELKKKSILVIFTQGSDPTGCEEWIEIQAEILAA